MFKLLALAACACFFVLSRSYTRPLAFPTVRHRANVTEIPSDELKSFVPFTQFARAAYCRGVQDWKCGEACDAIPGFQPTLTSGKSNFSQIFFVGYWPDQNAVVVAHEGTDPVKFLAILTDIKSSQRNLDTQLFPGVPDDVQVHDGFADEHEKTAVPILDEVKRLIEEKGAQNVFTVGHSLGGALAELDALYLVLNLPSSVHVKSVTYGTPRVGNVAYADMFDEKVPDFARINHSRDPIPILPGRRFGFQHPHGEIHLLDGGEAVACAPDENADAPECTIHTVPYVIFGDILDHLGPYDGIPIGTVFC